MTQETHPLNTLPIDILLKLGEYVELNRVCNLTPSIKQLILKDWPSIQAYLCNNLDYLYSKEIDHIELFTYITVETYKKLDFSKLKFQQVLTSKHYVQQPDEDNDEYDEEDEEYDEYGHMDVAEIITPDDHIGAAIYAANRSLYDYLMSINYPKKHKQYMLIAMHVADIKYLQYIEPSNKDLIACMHKACSSGYLNMVMYLCDKVTIDSDCLKLACDNGHYYVVKFLLLTHSYFDYEIELAIIETTTREYHRIAAYLLTKIKTITFASLIDEVMKHCTVNMLYILNNMTLNEPTIINIANAASKENKLVVAEWLIDHNLYSSVFTWAIRLAGYHNCHRMLILLNEHNINITPALIGGIEAGRGDIVHLLRPMLVIPPSKIDIENICNRYSFEWAKYLVRTDTVNTELYLYLIRQGYKTQLTNILSTVGYSQTPAILVFAKLNELGQVKFIHKMMSELMVVQFKITHDDLCLLINNNVNVKILEYVIPDINKKTELLALIRRKSIQAAIQLISTLPDPIA